MSAISIADFQKRYDWQDVPKDYFAEANDRSVILTLARHYQPKRVIEIGIQEGRTAKVLLDNCQSIESYIGIDVTPATPITHTPDRPPVPGKYALEDARLELRLIDGGSASLAELPEADFVFIDGDHIGIAPRHDTEMALAAVKQGVIVWHDYSTCRDVDSVVNDLNNGALKQAIIHVQGTLVAYLVIE